MLRVLLACLFLALPAAAQQVLYEPLPPAGSAYLRIINATPDALQVRPSVTGAATIGTENAQRISPYVVQENVADRAVAVLLQAGALRAELSLRLEVGSFNTLIVTAEGNALQARPFRDETQFNQVRARLAFYNAMGGCAQASLVLDPAGQAVFENVPLAEGRMRSVNPVTAAVRATCGTQRSQPFQLQGMEAGGVYSVWIMAPRGGAPITFMTRDTTTPWRR